MQKINPFLWFNTQAKEAAEFYTSIFKNSKITAVTHYPEGAMGPKGTVMTVVFTLEGQEFVALNGGPHYTITPGISLVINCDSQKEVDAYWARLSEGGQELQCGWLTDKFGVTWQVVPAELLKMIQDKDPKKVSRVFQAMMPMIKLDLQVLKQAYEQK